MSRLLAINLLFATLATLSSNSFAEAKLGESVPDFRLPDHTGTERTLSDFADRELIVVAFLGTECPLAKLYAVRLQTIADSYSHQDLAVVAVMSNLQDSLADIRTFVRDHHIKYPVLKDRRNEVADTFGAERTPQVFLLDRERVVRYQGRIDNQYLVGRARDQATQEDLRAAIDELLAGKAVSVPTTEASGCIIGRYREPNTKSAVTYSRDVAPILQARCVECHREDEIGPFSLTSYEEVAGWGEMLAEVVRERRMPPWHANPKHGRFANDRSLPDTEKEKIYQWVENGCPEGDPNDLPPPQTFTAGWQLPQAPDLVVGMKEAFPVPAESGPEGVPYKRFRVPSGFTEDKWVAAFDVQPGNRSVVHHTIVFAEPPGGKRRDDWIFLAAYVPGLRQRALPLNSAKRIPANSTFIFEMHYTPNGAEQQDQSKIGLVFADPSDVEKEVITSEIVNHDFEIPPHADDYVVTATSRPTKQDLTLYSLSPHMHLRGKEFRYELVQPTGEREVLLDVPAYDFNWQTSYRLAEPRLLPAGSVISCRAVFDNSQTNTANPDPTLPVRWGEQTWEEMMIGFLDVSLPRNDSRRAGGKPIKTGLDVIGLFDVADEDRDQQLDRAEASSANELLKQHFRLIDQDRDGSLQLPEILAALKLLPKRR